MSNQRYICRMCNASGEFVIYCSKCDRTSNNGCRSCDGKGFTRNQCRVCGGAGIVNSYILNKGADIYKGGKFLCGIAINLLLNIPRFVSRKEYKLYVEFDE